MGMMGPSLGTKEKYICSPTGLHKYKVGIPTPSFTIVAQLASCTFIKTGLQLLVPSDPIVRRRMAEKLAAHRKSLPYGGVVKRRRRSRTASTSPDLSLGDKHDSATGASLYCGSYGETSNSSSLCSGRVFSYSHGDRLPCSCERFPWDHRRTLECRLLAAGLSDRHRGSGELGGW